MRASYNKRCSEETAEKKQERLAKRRANYKTSFSATSERETRKTLILQFMSKHRQKAILICFISPISIQFTSVLFVGKHGP